MLLTKVLDAGNYRQNLFVGWELSVLKARDRVVRWFLIINASLFLTALFFIVFGYLGWTLYEFSVTPGFVLFLGWFCFIVGMVVFRWLLQREIRAMVKEVIKPLTSLAIVEIGGGHFLLLRRKGKWLLTQKLVSKKAGNGYSHGALLSELMSPDEPHTVTGAFLIGYKRASDFIRDSNRILFLLSDAIGESTVGLDESTIVKLQEI